jgi:hypothetical protein
MIPQVQGIMAAPLDNVGAPLSLSWARQTPEPVRGLNRSNSVYDVDSQVYNGNDVSVYVPMAPYIQPIQRAEASPYNTATLPSGELYIRPPGLHNDRYSRLSRELEGQSNIGGGYQKDNCYGCGIDRNWMDPVYSHASIVLDQAMVDPNPPGMTKGQVNTPSDPLSTGYWMTNPHQRANLVQTRPSGSRRTLATGSGIWGPVLQTQRAGYQRIAYPDYRMQYNI